MPQSNTSQMQLESQSNQQATPLNNLQKFLNNYNKFLQQNATIDLNPQTILSDIAINLLEPPQSISQQQNSEIYNLYQKGKKLPQVLDKDSRQVQEMITRLKKLKEDKLYETILFIEQLNFKLNKEYENQVNRGVQNGVYSKKPSTQGVGESLVSSHKTEKQVMRSHSLEKGEQSLGS